MKKFKILTVFGILLAMGITACNKGGDNSGDAQQSGDAASVSEQQSGGGASEHTHKWGSWSVIPGQEPTCTKPGKEQRSCKECDAVETRDKAALGHDWDNATPVEGSDTSTCTADGVQRVKCGRCDETKEVPAKAHHKFGAETDVAKTGTDDIAYKTAVCSVDSALKISFPTEVGGVYSGTERKSGTPEGYTKLKGSGSISWKLNLSGTKGYIGKMYHMACMDAFSSNSEKNYGYYTTSGSSTRAEGNFKFYVNGIEADKSAYMEISFGDLTKDGENDPALDAITSSPGPYSPVALCPLGDNVYIGPGENVFKYERTGSYNMVMRELVFIGTEYTHEHNNSTDTWAKDENQHWNACTNPGCPTNGKVNAANHTFQEVAPADDTETDAAHKARAATCSQEGIRVEVCSVCQYRKESPIAKTAHTFPTDGGWTVNTEAKCEEPGERQHECEVCHQIVKEVIPALGHTFGEVVENYAAGEGYIATTAHNCSVCGKSALRWASRDYDKTLSNGGSEVTVDGLDGVKTGDAENDGGQGNANPAVKVGNHFVYKVKVNTAVEKAGLSFKVKTRAANKAAPVFKSQSSDGKRGNYYDEATQTFTPAPARYGVRINGQEVYFNEDLLALEQNAPAAQILWFNFPLNSFALIEGINTIDVYCMGGYSMDAIFEFQLFSFPHITPSHVHNGADAWQSDDNNHWHLCTEAGCPLADGKYDVTAHTWGDPVVVEPTVDAAGSKTYTCSICGKTKVESIAKLPFVQFLGDDFKAGLSNSGTKATGTPKAGGDEFTVYKCSGTYTLTYNSAVAQKVTLRLLLTTKFSNVAAAGVWWQGNTQKFTVKVGETTLDAPFAKEAEPFLSGYGCSVESTAKDSGSSLAVPVWVDMLELDLAAGDNTIVVTFNGGGYTPWWGGAAFAKA